MANYEGVLYVEAQKIYEEMVCTIQDKRFTACKRNDSSLTKSKPDIALQFDIQPHSCECRAVKFSIGDLSKIMRSSKLEESPFFFSVKVPDRLYMFAAKTEQDRASWLKQIREILREKDKGTDAWISTGFLNDSGYKQDTNRFSNNRSHLLPSQRSAKDKSTQPGIKPSSATKPDKTDDYQKVNSAEEDKDDQTTDSPRVEKKKSILSSNSNKFKKAMEDYDEEDEENEDNEGEGFLCCKVREKILGLKVDTIVRMLKVCLAFPFVIVVSSLNLSNQYTFLRSVTGVQIMNILIYVAPVVYVRFVLSQFEDENIQRIAIGFYILIYLLPVGFVVSSKVKVASSTSKIEEGTFCFKPARSVRFTQANFFSLLGFVMEWIQHILYVLPLGIVTSEKQTKLSDFPPYLTFEVYFWISVISTFVCGLIIVLNTVLRGKIHYRFQNSQLVWFFLFNVGSPMFVTIVTILFMALWCDYSADPPHLIQQPAIVCYSDKHIVMARAALVAVAIYIIQHTLLPSGTFKETMRNNDLEIMFVPVYLQAHYLLKAIFCGVYVYFYEDNMTRVISLTLINMILLALNNFIKPCSVAWVNLLRDCFFIHAVLSGIISINYLAYDPSTSTKGMVISILISTVIFSAIGMYVYYSYTARSTEYSIASAFLDLEWQVSRGGSVHPRVLEPLISLTLSLEQDDWEIAKKYIGQLVWLISYPNMRVQFQSAWGLANLALLDDDARIKIHDAGGTKTLFEWYTQMDFVVQLEVLAAIVNLTLSAEVAEEMVTRHLCIPFFISLVASNKIKHAQFSAIAVANLARNESYREMIRKNGGIPALVGCIMSHDYQKRRHGCRALANMALSPSKEIELVFESKGLIDRIIKMAMRKEIETQREVVALIRNLSCHGRLRPLLLDRGVMKAVELSQTSVFDEVKEWCAEITLLLQREVSSGAMDLKALMRRDTSKTSSIGEADVDLLKKMSPLKGMVEWSTWGSKLESIFAPIFASIPTLVGSQVSTAIDIPLQIYLPHNITRTDLKRWRDTLSYIVVERPAHGKLSEYSTTSDYITYTPATGYMGTDFFTYRMTVGSSSTAPATMAITVYDPNKGSPFNSSEAAGGGDDVESNRRERFTMKMSPNNKTSKKANANDTEGIEMFYKEKEGKEPVNARSPMKAAPANSGNSTPFLNNLMKKTSIHAPGTEANPPPSLSPDRNESRKK